MRGFATYIHPDTLATCKPIEAIEFAGQSFPWFQSVCRALMPGLSGYPALPVRYEPFASYGAVHDAPYLRALVQMANDESPDSRPRLSMECTGLWYALPAYEAALGGIRESLDRMKAGTLERAYVFGAGGHHARRDRGHGYCVVNPLAAGARYAQSLGFRRVLIVDWDIHHGDGTQAIFAGDPNVHCASIHGALDMYMSAMNLLAEGTTIAGRATGHQNIPVLWREYPDDFPSRLDLGGRFYRTEEIAPAFHNALASLPWAPDLILIFSGYDGHRDDQGEGVTDWTEADYTSMTHAVLRAAARARCPVLSMHGGGYRMETTVSSALAHVAALAGGIPG